MTEDVLFHQDRHLGIITLNRPKALHALNLPMIQALQKQLSLWKETPSIHAVAILASPASAFCAGGDVRWLYQCREEETQLEFFWHEYRLNHYIHHYPKPYIALMDGITMGGGVGISLHGSHPIASERFVFAMPETSIGFFPDIGASYLLNHCPGALGLYLGLTGHRLGPIAAQKARLIKTIIHSSKFSEVLQQLAKEDLSMDAHARVSACLKLYTSPEDESIPLNPLINSCFSKPSLELILQNLRESKDSFAEETLKILEKKSPMSLQVCFEQLHKAKGKSLADCLNIDYTLAQHFMKAHDFYEGVRALLIDKDINPQWEPLSLALIHKRDVVSYFEKKREIEFS